MSEHSAGPWSVSTRNSWRIVDPHDNTIASTGTDSAISHDAHKANARLIAAAPDLLAALDTFIKQWNACGPNSDFGRYFQNVRDEAVAAIRKVVRERADA